jgi:hypothetical protein
MSGMATASDKPPAIVRSMRFDDMDSMARAMIGDHVEFVPPAPSTAGGTSAASPGTTPPSSGRCRPNPSARTAAGRTASWRECRSPAVSLAARSTPLPAVGLLPQGDRDVEEAPDQRRRQPGFRAGV